MTRWVTRKLSLNKMPSLAVVGWVVVMVAMLCGWACVPAVAQTPQDIAGTWQGTLPDGRIVLKIAKAGGTAVNDNWKGIFYSIDGDMGPQGRSTTSIVLQGTVFRFAIAPIDASYEGKLGADGASIAGTWTQTQRSHPLILQRVNEAVAWAIPEASKAMAANAVPEFDVAAIKPSDPKKNGMNFNSNGRHVSTVNTTVTALIAFAYGIHEKQIVGGPEWLNSSKYDTDGVPDVAGEPNMKQMQEMYKKLLTDRFKLTFHTEKRELPVYALTVGKNGPKLTKSLDDPNETSDQTFTQLSPRLVVLRVTHSTMGELFFVMHFVLDRPFVDHTGLVGRYDFLLQWTPDETQFGSMGIRFPPPGANPNAQPGLFTAIQEQLGLKLEAVKAPADVIVIDHVERPSEN